MGKQHPGPAIQAKCGPIRRGHADRVSGSVTVSLSPRMSVSGDYRRRACWVHQPSLAGNGTRAGAWSSALNEVGLDPRHAFPLPARVLRRPAPAHQQSPAPSCWSLPLSCWTSRPRRWTCCSRRRSVDLLRDLQRKRDLTYDMFISHDLRVVASLCQSFDRRCALARMSRKGRCGGPLQKSPKTDYTRASLFAAAFNIEAAPPSCLRPG